MLFSGKENVFMCLVHFKIFFKKYFLVFGKEVGKEEGRGKTQKNLDKPRRTRRDLAINSAISDRDWRRDLGLRLTTRSREASIAIGATGASRDRDLRSRSTARSREASIAIGANDASRKIAPLDLAFFLSLVLPLRELSLRVPSFGNHLKWK